MERARQLTVIPTGAKAEWRDLFISGLARRGGPSTPPFGIRRDDGRSRHAGSSQSIVSTVPQIVAVVIDSAARAATRASTRAMPSSSR